MNLEIVKLSGKASRHPGCRMSLVGDGQSDTHLHVVHAQAHAFFKQARQ